MLEELLAYMREEGKSLAPALFFIDPYGFKVPGSVLRELMKFPRVELFVNVIWRELDMAMRQGTKMKATLDSVFAGHAWQDIAAIDNHDERAARTVNLLREMTGAQWATHIRMLGDNQATRYLLLHLTNHDAGRDLMKECMWKACPDGGYYARKSDDPSQEYLIKPEPDLTPLKEWLTAELTERPRRWQTLFEDLRDTIWRQPHLNEVIRTMRKEKRIEGSDYEGKFLPSSNPLLHLNVPTARA